MTEPSADRITEWEGGSLSELVSMLQAVALPVRIEVIAPGTTDSNAGEVHLLAGGLADAFAGSLRRDDAVAALQRLEGARFLVECRLPDPESGSLNEPGPREGSLKDRPLASLMRYCEDYVLTCRVEVWRGQDRAVISYRRGEINGTVVDGNEGSDRLPEVMAWTEGSYEIILPAPVLPQIPSRKREGSVAGTRKRHTTLSMMPTGEPRPEGPGIPPIEAGKPGPSTQAAVAAPPRSTPPQPAVTSGAARVASPPAATRPGSHPPQRPAARQPVPREPVGPIAQKAHVPPPAVAKPAAVAVRPMQPLQPEMTTRGTPPAPAAPLAPPSVRQPAQRPTMQGSPASPSQPKPSAPAQADKPQAARTAKPTPSSVASNDLLPASGTIEAKPKHANQLPPTAPPVQVAEEPLEAGEGQRSTPDLDTTHAPTSRRVRAAARKGISEHPVRVYIFVGLAIGAGVVLAYTLYLYLPFGHL